MKWHPFAEKFPLLEGEEWEAFKASIRETNGPELRVTYRLVKGEKQGLDGRNRYRACQELGIECPMEKVFLDDDQVKAFIIRRNINRRHLGTALRWQLIHDLNDEKLSTRRIADTIGVSQSTVRRDLATPAPGAPIGAPETSETLEKSTNQVNTPQGKVTGSDGKTYPATKPAPASPEPGTNGHANGAAKPKPKANPEPAAEEPAAPDVVRDDIGYPVPEKCLPAFETAKAIGKACRDIDDLVRRVEELGKSDGGRLMHTASQIQTLRNVRKSLWASRATHVCPYCSGTRKLCEGCKGPEGQATGWTNRATYESAPQERRDAMTEAAGRA